MADIGSPLLGILLGLGAKAKETNEERRKKQELESEREYKLKAADTENNLLIERQNALVAAQERARANRPVAPRQPTALSEKIGLYKNDPELFDRMFPQQQPKPQAQSEEKEWNFKAKLAQENPDLYDKLYPVIDPTKKYQTDQKSQDATVVALIKAQSRLDEAKQRGASAKEIKGMELEVERLGLEQKQAQFDSELEEKQRQYDNVSGTEQIRSSDRRLGFKTRSADIEAKLANDLAIAEKNAATKIYVSDSTNQSRESINRLSNFVKSSMFAESEKQDMVELGKKFEHELNVLAENRKADIAELQAKGDLDKAHQLEKFDLDMKMAVRKAELEIKKMGYKEIHTPGSDARVLESVIKYIDKNQYSMDPAIVEELQGRILRFMNSRLVDMDAREVKPNDQRSAPAQKDDQAELDALLNGE